MFGLGNNKQFRLFTLLGTPVYADASILILVAIIMLFWGSGGPAAIVLSVFAAAALILSVILHEIGHAVAIKRLGYGFSKIVLSGLGGVTQWRGRATKRDTILISLAGPAVSLALGVGGWLLYRQVGASMPGFAAALLRVFFVVNLFWAVFNLLPIYPMDGGKVTRTALSMRMPEYRATMTSLKVSMVAAGLITLLGIFLGEIFVVAVLAWILINNWNEYQSLKA